MKDARNRHLAPHRPTHQGATHLSTEEKEMSRKNRKVVVSKQSKKIVDSRRVRFGAGCAPRVLRTVDVATQDSGAIRFGAGCAPARLRK
jgi:hypothetical protein